MSTQIEVHDGVVLDLEGATTLVEALRRWCAAVRDLAESNRDSDPQWAGDLVRVEHDVAALLDRYVPTGSAGDHATLPGPLEPMRQVEAELDLAPGLAGQVTCPGPAARGRRSPMSRLAEVVDISHRPAGRSSVTIICPWCSCEVEARLWSLAGVGKRCECGALLARHNATGDVWAERGPR